MEGIRIVLYIGVKRTSISRKKDDSNRFRQQPVIVKPIFCMKPREQKLRSLGQKYLVMFFPIAGIYMYIGVQSPPKVLLENLHSTRNEFLFIRLFCNC